MKTELSILTGKFKQFGKATLQQKNPDKTYIASQLSRYQKQYRRMGREDIYVSESLSLAENFSQVGMNDFTGIIYSGLIKIPSIPVELKEYIIKKAFEVANKSGDKVHALARIADLKILYKNEKSKKKYVKTLFEEEKLLTEIVNNYSNTISGHRTVGRSVGEIKTYKFRLGASKTDLAKAHLRTNPELSRRKAEEATMIFDQLGRLREAAFANSLISQPPRT